MAAVIGAPKSSDGNQPGADITQPDGWSTAEGAVRIRPQPSAVHATELSLQSALALCTKALEVLSDGDFEKLSERVFAFAKGLKPGP